MSRPRVLRGVVLSGFPRVSGDEPFQDDLNQLREAFSPRERG
ncbi:hypothetical protein ACTODO_00517 [Schaalia dentiphila ATCC 17982]|uniref:Uncharacterized protein n=1 Tax=Schaalia dentiphila ATCC 17982 TaxID=411466 RepID=A7BA57_9ACTO|nr:hypothetical protein ACTODO_00517 [Schaalia odontolytica ATCC 17982]